ncbi:hypothetical protein, partial [Bradyrhizobium sp. SZCCHNS2005]|uniref:hypothetical protein n=1 Tax=Bradyrhizobium sp. SZCCHNS2005 TaxID=3057303 RepID=UPI0028EB8FD1
PISIGCSRGRIGVNRSRPWPENDAYASSVFPELVGSDNSALPCKEKKLESRNSRNWGGSNATRPSSINL